MATPPNFQDLARQQRTAAFNRLSFNNVVNSGNPTSNDVAIVAPSNEAAPIQPGYTTTIRSTYPKAVLAEDFGNRCATFIQSLCGYAPSSVLAAASICSDDKNAPIFANNDFGQYPVSLQQFLGPFFAGGIGGFPFPGIVGLFAYMSHYTNANNGALFIYVQPHIGITADGQVGFMRRRDQEASLALSQTCGAVNAAQARVVGPLSAVAPTFGAGQEFSQNDFQQYTLVNTLWSNTSVRAALTGASNAQGGTYAQRMVLATNAILSAANSTIEQILPAAYTALSGALGASYNFKPDVFVSAGTFINVDDGYKAYVDVQSFKLYSANGSYTTYTSQFTAGLLPS